MKKAWMAGVAVAMAAAWAWGADAGTDWRFRAALEKALDKAAAGLAESPIEASTPVAVLPIQGDDGEGLAARRLRVALYDAGKTCVEWKDDPMLTTLLETIDWKELKQGILDPETIDRIGKVQGAKVLLTGWVENTGRSERRPTAELELRALEVATARQLWAGVFRSPEPGKGPKTEPVTSTPWPLNVDVAVRGGEGAAAVADELEAYAKGRLADLGYRVGTDQEADMELTLEPNCELFDREGQWRTYNGTLRASLSAQGAEKHVIGETTLATKGTPGVGDADGRRNLVYAMESQLGAWMNRTLKPDAAEFAAVVLDVVLADPVETGKDRAGIVEIRKALEGLPGVRRVAVAAQDDAAGQVSYKVVYKPADVPDGVANALFAAHPELAAYLP